MEKEAEKPEIKEVKKEDVTFTITQQEASILMQLVDLGVKAGGLQTAQHAAYFANKFGVKFQ